MLKANCKLENGKIKKGNDRYTTEILGNEMNMLGGRQSSGDGGAYDQSQPASQSASISSISNLRGRYTFLDFSDFQNNYT